MKKNILLVFILMSLCVVGITALQLYYSYTNYIFAEKVFKKDSNEALQEARDSAIAINNRNIVKQFRGWMEDTTFVNISSRWDTVKKTTVFTIKEIFPSGQDGQREISMSIEEITKRFDSITPESKKIFINHLANSVHGGLEKGTVWFFTQQLGQRLSKAYNKPLDMKIVEEQYRLALDRKAITLPFAWDMREKDADYCTHQVNFGTEKVRWLQACFSGINTFLAGQLKWVIGGSVLLIIITLVCFWYTIKTLLNQHKLNRIKDDFISNMTHEIHTPLASILVTAEALKKFDQDERDRGAYIDIILHQGAKLAKLTDEILAGAKMKKSRLEKRDTLELNAFIEGIIKEEQYKNIHFKPAHEPVIFRGNALHLGNALRNLIDNAIKYNTSSIPLIIVSAKAEGGEIEISVADNGLGIPNVEKENIFNEFYRIPSGNVHNIKGYGLGLSYVKKVVTAHKGSITVKDNKPAGAVFIIKLPI